MNELCLSSSFSPKNNYDTWSFAGNMERPMQLDNFFICQYDRKCIIDCGAKPITGIQLDDIVVELKVQLAKFIPKTIITINAKIKINTMLIPIKNQ